MKNDSGSNPWIATQKFSELQENFWDLGELLWIQIDNTMLHRPVVYFISPSVSGFWTPIVFALDICPGNIFVNYFTFPNPLKEWWLLKPTFDIYWDKLWIWYASTKQSMKKDIQPQVHWLICIICISNSHKMEYHLDYAQLLLSKKQALWSHTLLVLTVHDLLAPSLSLFT